MKKFLSIFFVLNLMFAQLAYSQDVIEIQKSNFQMPEDKYIFDDNYGIGNIENSSDDSLKGYVGQVSAGSSFDAYLKEPINTATASKGDNITAVLTRDWVYNNVVIAPQGSLVYGTLSKAKRATYAYQNGSIQIDFNQIQTPEGKVLKIQTEKIDFKVDSTGKAGSVAGKVVAGAAIGLLGALLVAAIGGRDQSISKALLIGTSVGAGTGLITSAAEKGVDAEIPAFTEIVLVLEKPLDVAFLY